MKYFVIDAESAIKQRAMPHCVNMDAAQGRRRGGRKLPIQKRPRVSGAECLEERRTNHICGTIHGWEASTAVALAM